MQSTFSTKATVKAYAFKIAANVYKFSNEYIKIQYLFIFLFASTGCYKLLDISLFRFTIWRATLLRPYYVQLSYAIPIAELVIAVLLTFQFIKIRQLKIPSRLIGFYAAFILMLLFTGYVAYSLMFAKYLPCTCGGIISAMSWKQHLLFNILFSFLALRGIILNRNTSSNTINSY